MYYALATNANARDEYKCNVELLIKKLFLFNYISEKVDKSGNYFEHEIASELETSKLIKQFIEVKARR